MVHFDIASKVNQLKELEEKINAPDFWNDQNKALKVVNEKNELDNIVNSYFFVQTKLKDISDTYEMIKDLYDEELHALICDELLLIEEKLKEFEIETLLSNEFDTLDAIIEIHPGAGGTESQDWADMLYRMYIRYAEAHNYKINIIDEQRAVDAGIKSVSFIVKGKYAYGYLKAEKGVHRLVRISPFDSNSRRHTSFASVDVVPQIEEGIDIKIKIKI